jgi:excisionase family DNA binding protein
VPKTGFAAQHLDEYLTIEEVAQRLKVKKKTIQNKMAAGIFQEGVHYFRPYGLSSRFKWSAIIAWLEGCESRAQKDGDIIPMAKGYTLGEPNRVE